MPLCHPEVTQPSTLGLFGLDLNKGSANPTTYLLHPFNHTKASKTGGNSYYLRCTKVHVLLMRGGRMAATLSLSFTPSPRDPP